MTFRRGRVLMRVGIGVTVLAATCAGVGAASLTLARVRGERDAPAAGVLTLDPSDDARTPTAYRCAQTFPDLALTAWAPLDSAAPVTIRRLLPGYQSSPDQSVSCEVSYTTGEPLTVSVVEDLSRRSGVSDLPRAFLNPRPGVLFDLMTSDTTGYGAWPVVQYNDQGRSLMRFAYGNNFVPLEWSPDGYAWSSEFTRGVDKGEPRRHSVIVAHVYARWMGADVLDWSPAGTSLSVELAGEDLDLKGGGIYVAVLVATPDGLHMRYHLRRPLRVMNGDWAKTELLLRDLTGWECSFASNRVPCSAVPDSPDLHFIEAVEIMMTDGELPPTGVLKMRHLRVQQ
jgi:hypothetical protein